MSQAKATIDPEVIKEWVESHGGHPAAVIRTESDDDVGIIRVDFPGFSGEDTLEEISWDDWFEKFESSQLAFLYQDEPDSRFNKLVSRESVEDQLEKSEGGGSHKGGSKKKSHGHAHR